MRLITGAFLPPSFSLEDHLVLAMYELTFLFLAASGLPEQSFDT